MRNAECGWNMCKWYDFYMSSCVNREDFHPETPARPRLIRLSRTTGGGVAGQTAFAAPSSNKQVIDAAHTSFSLLVLAIGRHGKQTTVSFLFSHPHRPVSGNWNLHIRRICLFQLHWQDSRSRLLGFQLRCIPRGRRSAPNTTTSSQRST